jgi:hypothetical protein
LQSDQLITNCFWDIAKNGGREDPKGRWHKYTPRFVCHYVMDHILSVRFSNPTADENSLFTVDNFKKVLGRMNHVHRRVEEDTSCSVVWRSSPRDLVSWERMGPMLVRIPISHGPQIEQEPIPELYPLARANVTFKDLFFTQIGCSHPASFAQINHTIIARLIIYAQRHETASSAVRNAQTKPVDPSHLERVFIAPGLRLTMFFDTFQKAKDTIVTVWKHYKKQSPKWQIIKSRAMINDTTWVAHGERGIDVLQCTPTEESRMATLLEHPDSFHAVKMAESGWITRTFLLWLMQQKEWYNSERIRGTMPKERAVRAHCHILHDKTGDFAES